MKKRANISIDDNHTEMLQKLSEHYYKENPRYKRSAVLSRLIERDFVKVFRETTAVHSNKKK